jgi:serine/threonine protein kinase
LIPKNHKLAEKSIKEFLNEADVLSKIDHPNVVKVFGIHQDAKSYYLVMEL